MLWLHPPLEHVAQSLPLILREYHAMKQEDEAPS
jgi:hypothetical protein